jgi:hypothetical protein
MKRVLHSLVIDESASAARTVVGRPTDLSLQEVGRAMIASDSVLDSVRSGSAAHSVTDIPFQLRELSGHLFRARAFGTVRTALRTRRKPLCSWN